MKMFCFVMVSHFKLNQSRYCWNFSM